MNLSSLPLLIQVLRAPASMAALSLEQWELLLRQAGAANLIPSLHGLALDYTEFEALPAPARTHLRWHGTLARRHVQAVHWEVNRIAEALAPLDGQVVLLKGAAYAAAGLRAGHGRLFSDIDIMVARARLPQVESALRQHGWVGSPHDAYDERYYREWMHEIPPMVHVRRESVLDVHHTILPLTARARPDAASLLANARALPGLPGIAVLAPTDMLLHSATHLFYDGEFNKGLRDLFDVHRLLAELGADPAFWDALPARAHTLQLERPLFYALRYAILLLGTPVPAAVLAALRAAAPAPPLLALMDALFERALMPLHASCAGTLTGAAHGALYLRGNWLRMPPLLLARHLLHKAVLSKPRAI